MSLQKIRSLTSFYSENPVVQRAIKAVHIIYSMTSRIPQLMKQSHLESNEGKSAVQNVHLRCFDSIVG